MDEFQYSKFIDRPEVYASVNSPLFPSLEDADSDKLGRPRVFSTIDMVAYAVLPTKKTYRLGNLNTLTIQSHRDKFPVTSMGPIKIRGITGGHRMIAGTMVFSSYDRNVWFRLVEGVGKPVGSNLNRIMPDDLPPFDITITFVNELGDLAMAGLIGVSILDEGTTYSVDNIQIMESYSYMARERIPYQPATVYHISLPHFPVMGRF